MLTKNKSKKNMRISAIGIFRGSSLGNFSSAFSLLVSDHFLIARLGDFYYILWLWNALLWLFFLLVYSFYDFLCANLLVGWGKNWFFKRSLVTLFSGSYLFFVYTFLTRNQRLRVLISGSIMPRLISWTWSSDRPLAWVWFQASFAWFSTVNFIDLL
jgi:hypothetical protein